MLKISVDCVIHISVSVSVQNQNLLKLAQRGLWVSVLWNVFRKEKPMDFIPNLQTFPSVLMFDPNRHNIADLFQAYCVLVNMFITN